MITRLWPAAALLAALSFSGLSAQQERLGQAGLTFLEVPIGARALAVGGMRPSEADAAQSLFWNPGSLGYVEHGAAWATLQSWIGDISHRAATAALPVSRIGTLAITFHDVDYGTLHATRRADNDQGFEDLGVFSPTNQAFGVAFGRQITDRLGLGVHLRWVQADFGTATVGIDPTDPALGFTTQENDLSTLSIDIGTSYTSGYRGLSLGVAVRNFAQEARVQDKYFGLPLVFDVNGTVDLLQFLQRPADGQSLRASLDVLVPRDSDPATHLAFEYGWRDVVTARVGYTADKAQERGFAAAGSLRLPIGPLQPSVEFGWVDMGVFGGLSTVGFGVRF